MGQIEAPAIGIEDVLNDGEPEAGAVATLVEALKVTQESEPSCSRKLITALRRPNAALVLVIIAVATMLSLTLLWPIATGLFRFGPLHVDDLIVTFGAGVLVLVLLEFMKPLWRKRLRS